MDNKKEDEKAPDDYLSAIWGHPLGKAILIIGGGFALLGVGAAGFKLGAITMNAYKDFRDASRR